MMTSTWVFAAILMGPTGGQTKPIVVPVPGATMTCTKEGDHLVCVVPLDKGVTNQPVGSSAPKARPYKPSPPMPALPDPEASAQLKAAEANIALAKSLLSTAREPEEAAFAQQLLYWANEQYRTAEALLHTVRQDLHDAADPFESGGRKNNVEPISLCTARLGAACSTLPGLP